MAKSKVVVCCWLHGHETEQLLTRRQEEALGPKIAKGKAVCPVCRDAGLGNQPIFIKEGQTIIGSSKMFQCKDGHVTTVSAFTNGMLHVKFGPGNEDFVNIEGTIEDLDELIDSGEIFCHHDCEGESCGLTLSATDDSTLSLPVANNIKTRTRVGDLWDRHGVDPVRPGHYDGDGHYKETRSERANKARLEKMRERNVAENKLPGKRITKPTKKTYSRRSKDSIDS